MTSDTITTPAAPPGTGVSSGPSPRPPTRRRSPRRWLPKAVLYVLLALFSVPFIYPTIWMIFSAFKPTDEIFRLPPTLLPDRWTLEGVERIFTFQPFAQQYLNSLYIAVVVTVFTVLVCSLAGYAFARIHFPGRNLLFIIFISGMFVPGEVTIIPIFRWVGELGLMNTHWPLILLPIFGGNIFGVFIFRQFFLSLPVELEEAGRLDGLGRLGIFARIAFPLAGPASGAVAIMTFLAAFNNYFAPLIFLRSENLFTVALGLTRYSDAYGESLQNTQLGATALTVIPILIVFLFAQRQFVEGLSRAGLKG
jgi:multiple sugar transport system permease protein